MKRSLVVLTARLILAGALLLTLSNASAQTEGIFAEFNTSMGSFTCAVEYATAPKAAANFIGLATGERPWLDLTTGMVQSKPFYDGLIFHRVIAGFMNQSGSPNGEGTDGPGYSFVDEFDPDVRHDSFGVLSSANSGPDSNGAQIFITVEPTPWLDDVHTVFGRLTGGSNVVYEINHVATDANDKPLTNVVIESMVIRRVGPEAEAFDIDAQGLPEVVSLEAGIGKQGENVSLTFSNQLNVDNRLYSTTNLVSWSGERLGIETSLPVSDSVVRSASEDRQFFRMAQVHYLDNLHVPKSMLGKDVALTFSTGQGVLILELDEVGAGAYDYNGSPGSIQGYNWICDPYRGRFKPIGYSGLYPMDLHLDFDSITNGTFRGTVYPNYPYSTGSFSVAGAFTSTP